GGSDLLPELAFAGRKVEAIDRRGNGAAPIDEESVPVRAERYRHFARERAGSCAGCAAVQRAEKNLPVDTRRCRELSVGRKRDRSRAQTLRRDRLRLSRGERADVQTLRVIRKESLDDHRLSVRKKLRPDRVNVGLGERPGLTGPGRNENELVAISRRGRQRPLSVAGERQSRSVTQANGGRIVEPSQIEAASLSSAASDLVE